MCIAQGTRLNVFKGKAPFIPDEKHTHEMKNEKRRKKIPRIYSFSGIVCHCCANFVGLDSDQINTSACAYFQSRIRSFLFGKSQTIPFHSI